MFTPAVWRVCKENEEFNETVRQFDLQEEPTGRTTPPRQHRDVNVTVSHIEPSSNDEVSSADNVYEEQPAYNPYLTNTREKETHF